MDRSLVAELHYIAPVSNLSSIAQWGLVDRMMKTSAGAWPDLTAGVRQEANRRQTH